MDRNTQKTPFDIATTKVLKPNLNNERIIAQNGWFTSHSYSNKFKRFIALDRNKLYKDRIFFIEISGTKKTEIIEQVNHLGVNFRSMFPDLEGICKQINWFHLDRY